MKRQVSVLKGKKQGIQFTDNSWVLCSRSQRNKRKIILKRRRIQKVIGPQLEEIIIT